VVLRVDSKGKQHVLVGQDLPQVTGVAVAPNGTIYASAFGTSAAGAARSGEVVRLRAH
jgi:hypothetical protein